VDRGTSSEIKTSHKVRPTVSVPGPASNGIIDDGGPDEDKDNHRKNTSTLGSSTNSKSRGNGSKHALVNSKDQIGDLGTANRGIAKDTSEEGVIKVTDELSTSFTEC